LSDQFFRLNKIINEEHIMVRASARKFAETEIVPIVESMEETQDIPKDIFRKAGQAGFIGSYIPVLYGGGGGDLFTEAIIKEEITKVSAGVAASITINSLIYGNSIFRFGTEDQKKRYLIPVLRGQNCASWALTEPEAGSDALSIKTTSVKAGDNYIINGSKTLITNAPIADFIVVHTRTYGSGVRGGTAFIVERDTEGLSFGKALNKTGLRPSPTGEIYFDNVRVDESQVLGQEGRGFEDMLECLSIERVSMALTSVGIAQACLNASRRYALERKQFGRRIADFQLIKSKLADMATNIEITRSYAYQLLYMIQQGINNPKEASIAKLFASEMAKKCCLEAIQIHGGYGLMKEYPVERYLRDCLYLPIGGGTSEIQKLIIAKEILK